MMKRQSIVRSDFCGFFVTEFQETVHNRPEKIILVFYNCSTKKTIIVHRSVRGSVNPLDEHIETVGNSSWLGRASNQGSIGF